MALFVWEPHKERTWPSFLVTTQCVFNPWAHWLGKLLPDVHQVDCEVRPLAADGPIPSFTAGFCYYQWVVSKKTTILCAIHGSISVYLKPFSFVNCWLVLGCLQRMIHFKTHRWFYWGKRIIGCGLETGGILWGQGLTFQPFQFFAQGDLNCPANPFRWHGLVDDGWLRFCCQRFCGVNPFRFDANGLFRIIMNYSMFCEGLNTPSTHWPFALVWNAVLHGLHKYPMVYQYFPNYNIIKKYILRLRTIGVVTVVTHSRSTLDG